MNLLMLLAIIHRSKFSIFGKLYVKLWSLLLLCMTFTTKITLRVHLIKLYYDFSCVLNYMSFNFKCTPMQI